MSPEGFIDCIYGPKTDVWAFGIMIFELLHGDTPYSFCKLENDLRYHLSLRFDRSKVRGTITSDLKEVIYRCLEVDESKRISIQQLRDTNYFRRLYYFASQQVQQTVEEVRHPIFLHVERSHSSEGFQQLNAHDNNAKYNGEIHNLGKNKEVQSPALIPTFKDRPKPAFLEPPRDAIRLGRPISTEKQLVKLNPPQISRERLKSIDNKKPVDKYIIVTTTINFKAAVNLLHYCRGLFRCVQLMISIK